MVEPLHDNDAATWNQTVYARAGSQQAGTAYTRDANGMPIKTGDVVWRIGAITHFQAWVNTADAVTLVPAGSGFDHRDPEVRALMDERAQEQGRALGSPLAVGDGGRRVVTDAAEMRRAHQAERDPLGVDPDPALSSPDPVYQDLMDGWQRALDCYLQAPSVGLLEDVDAARKAVAELGQRPLASGGWLAPVALRRHP